MRLIVRSRAPDRTEIEPVKWNHPTRTLPEGLTDGSHGGRVQSPSRTTFAWAKFREWVRLT